MKLRNNSAARSSSRIMVSRVTSDCSGCMMLKIMQPKRSKLRQDWDLKFKGNLLFFEHVVGVDDVRHHVFLHHCKNKWKIILLKSLIKKSKKRKVEMWYRASLYRNIFVGTNRFWKKGEKLYPLKLSYELEQPASKYVKINSLRWDIP